MGWSLFFRLSGICLFSSLLFCNIQASEKIDDKKTTFNIGVLYWSMDISGQVAMRQGIESATKIINAKADKNNLTSIKLHPFVAGNGEAGIERQIVQMDKLIEQNVDLIIVQPANNAALAKSLIKANKKNIPVVAYDQYISGGELASFITSDNYQAGYLDGEYIASKFDDSYSIKLILVEYPYVSSTVERVDGFIDALADNQQEYNILNTYTAVDPIGGQKAVEQLLKDFPNKNSIDVVFTINDGGGLNIVNGLKEASRNEIMVATIDGDPLSISNIANNQLTIINSAQFCQPIGEEALHTAYNILNGKTVLPQKLIPVYPVTKETLSSYPGWGGPIPKTFKKPWPSKSPYWGKNQLSMNKINL